MVGITKIQIARASVSTVTIWPIPIYTSYIGIVLWLSGNLIISPYARIMPSCYK